MTHKIDEPVDVIFQSIDDLRETGELAGKPYTPQIMIGLGYMVVANLPIFRDNIRRWLR